MPGAETADRGGAGLPSAAQPSAGLPSAAQPSAKPPSAGPRPSQRCPCLSGETYAACCGAFHAGFADGVWPATAETLMRSRFSAFAAGRPDYLLATWHASTRPAGLRLDGDVEWTRLEILRRAAGGPFDADGVVEFAAHYRDGAGRGVQRESSRFVREGGRWYYLDGR